MEIKKVDFSSSNYILEEHPKYQIYLHHTAGNANGEGVFQWWASNSERIATCVAISGKGDNTIDGEIIQGFGSKYWAYHLGLKKQIFTNNNLPYISLDKNSIGIEICNWGDLDYRDGRFYNYVNREVPESEVIELAKPFKGDRFFHNYTDAQIESVHQLLVLWKQRYNIPLLYNDDIWDISKRALNGVAGVFTHNSVRADKNDVYPHPKLIEMLKSLS
jgi:N-acetyl-anhydromuramyl-L-alanine amidase AmpD